MNKQIALFVSAAAAALLAASASAGVITSYSKVGGTTGGGPFRVVTTTDGIFNTFCLEITEGISTGEVPYNYTVEQVARGGGAFGGSPDPLGTATAWVYDQYTKGLLGGYTDDQIQQAIWWLENETGGSLPNTGVNNALVTAANLAVTGLGANNDYGTGLYFPVAVMNLTKTRSGVTEQRQSLLIRVPDGGMTLLMLGAGLTMVGIARRRLA